MTNTAERGYADYVSSTDIREAMHVGVPEGVSGDVEVRRFEVSGEDADRTRLQAAMHGGRGYVAPGSYTALYRRGRLWMSDTSDERRDHIPFVREVDRQSLKTVLVGGLGLGMVAAALAILPTVERVTIIEKDEDVIALVGPWLREVYADAQIELEIIHGDATDPKPLFPRDQRWDAAWHDIWEELCTDNLTEMGNMGRRYARRVGWQDFWGRDYLKAQKARERQHQALWGW